MLSKALIQDKGSIKASRIARRLYGGHTFVGAGQQKNNEDEQTRKRLLINYMLCTCDMYLFKELSHGTGSAQTGW